MNERKLFVMFLEHRMSGAMVWRGMASGHLHANASVEKREKKVHEVVQTIFRNYPPK